MKAAEDREDEFHDSARKEKTSKHFGKETEKTGVVGRASQGPNHSVGQSFEVRGESVSGLIVGFEAFVKSRFQ